VIDTPVSQMEPDDAGRAGAERDPDQSGVSGGGAAGHAIKRDSVDAPPTAERSNGGVGGGGGSGSSSAAAPAAAAAATTTAAAAAAAAAAQDTPTGCCAPVSGLLRRRGQQQQQQQHEHHHQQQEQQEQQQQLRRVVPVRRVLADAYEYHGLTGLARFVTLAVFASLVLYLHWTSTAPGFKAAVQGSFKAYGSPDWQGQDLAGVSTMMDGVEYAAGWLQLWIESSKEAGASNPGGARRAWAGSRGRGRLRRDP
jgi:hypothetical protein